MFIFKSIISFLKDKSYRNLLFTTNFFIVLGTVVYHYIEGWSWLDSLYFLVITLTTIGYGDFSPQTDLGKIFTLLYIVVGVALILGFF
jgi:voltage-gated potassium channel